MPFKTTAIFGPLRGDRHVIPLAGRLLGVHLGRDQVVERAGIVHAGARRVIERDLDPRVDRVFQVADPDEDPRVAAF